MARELGDAFVKLNGRKIVTIDPIPEGDWSLGSKGNAMVYSGSLKLSSIHIVDVDRPFKYWVRDGETGEAIARGYGV